jgi:hypothetical protein
MRSTQPFERSLEPFCGAFVGAGRAELSRSRQERTENDDAPLCVVVRYQPKTDQPSQAGRAPMSYEAPKIETIRPIEAVLTQGSKLRRGGGGGDGPRRDSFS